MKAKTTSCRQPSGLGADSIRVKTKATGSPAPASLRGDALRRQEFRELIQQQLGKLLGELSAEFAGAHFHIAWAPPPHEWSTEALPAACFACCRLSGSSLLPDCQACGPTQHARALATDGNGHRFTCQQGVHNHWFPIRLRQETLGLAYLQALERAPSQQPDHEPEHRAPAWRVENNLETGRADARCSDRTVHASITPQSAAQETRKMEGAPAALAGVARGGGTGGATPPEPGAETAAVPSAQQAIVMSHGKFTRAARFLRLNLEHLQTSSLAELQAQELDKVRRALQALENDDTRLRKKLHVLMPAFRDTSSIATLESHAERMVRVVLNRIQTEYAQPLTLRKCARDLRVNAAYLSHLFSEGVGMPFKKCLTEVRVEKARELLGDPARNVAEVASAVGFASANRFRLAFKQVTGLSPRMWRETLREPPSGAPPLESGKRG